MFSADDAPFGAKKYTPKVSAGPAFVKFVNKAGEDIESAMQDDTYLALTLYHNSNPPNLDSLCGDRATAFSNANGTIPVTKSSTDPTLRKTYYFRAQTTKGHSVVEVDEVDIDVMVTSQVRALFRICPDGLSTTVDEGTGVMRTKTTTILDGRWLMETELKFVNPYGYFSAHLYGLIPFFWVYTVCVGLFLLAYAALALKYPKELIALHYGTLVLILITFVGSILYLSAFAGGNESGEPLCFGVCVAPYFVAVVVDEIKNTLARLILLVVCLGLGVSKPSLPQNVKVKIAAVHALYFGFSVNDKIHLLTVLDENQDAGTAFWALPPVLLNIFIILWIYFALTKTMQELVAGGQTFKHKMMQKLSKILAGFILLWSFTTIVLFLARVEAIIWPWQMEWFWFAIWYAIYLGAVIAIGWTWGPSESSSRLASTMQLSQFDDDEDVEVDLEMTDLDAGNDGDETFSLDIEDNDAKANGSDSNANGDGKASSVNPI